MPPVMSRRVQDPPSFCRETGPASGASCFLKSVLPEMVRSASNTGTGQVGSHKVVQTVTKEIR